MKKRVLAIVLAATMVTGTCMTAMAAEAHGGDGHGTSEDALVSEEEDEMYTNKVDAEGKPIKDKTTGQTQFYIKVDKDATSANVTIPTTSDYTGDGDICHYDVRWEVNRKSNLSVTVPLYVCMYGYGGDGTVVTPDEDAYRMVNNSTYEDYKEVKEIIPCYKVLSVEDAFTEYKTAAVAEVVAKATDGLTDETEIATVTEKTTLDATLAAETKFYKETFKLIENRDDATAAPVEFTETELSGQWGCVAIGDQNYLVRLSDCDIHTNDEECENKETIKYFYRDTAKAWKNEGDGSLKDSEGQPVLTVGTKWYAGGNDEPSYLPVNVPTISAEINTWNIKSMSDADELKAGEIAMTIKDVDLFDIMSSNDNGDENTLDIRDLKWTMPGASDNILGLPVKAVIAGGNVNEEGCVPVVKVTYKVSPAMDLIKDTVYKKKTTPPSDES
jgi:hypothetical protein